MNIQVALDRMSIEESVQLVRNVQEQVDWIEVGTSLIKEYGMESVRAMKKAFPNKVVVADMKTNDNAVYECALCFDAGADVSTVMGTAPLITIEACIAEAKKRGGQIMIDLLNTSLEQQKQLSCYDAIFCRHISKDEQELGRTSQKVRSMPEFPQTAVAGGVSLENISEMIHLEPDVLIIGSAITKAVDPFKAALLFNQRISREESK